MHAVYKAQKHIIQPQNKPNEEVAKDHFFVNSKGKTVRINLQEIDFVESMNEYVKIFLSTGKYVITLMRLKNLEEFLPKNNFMRVHRSYIVNVQNITTIERNRIVFYNNVYIPISEQYKAEFNKFIEESFL